MRRISLLLALVFGLSLAMPAYSFHDPSRIRHRVERLRDRMDRALRLRAAHQRRAADRLRLRIRRDVARKLRQMDLRDRVKLRRYEMRDRVRIRRGAII